MSNLHQRKSESGFTLIELLIVIALIGILSGIMAPGLVSWKQNSDLNADMRRLYAFFQQTRLEAVKRNDWTAVTFNQVVNGATFDYVSFADDGDSIFNPATDQVITTGNFTPGVTMTANNFPANGGGLLTASYDNRGRIGGNAGAAIMGATVTLEAATGNEHNLIFNRHGRMRIQ